jgi:hypothetical protein
MGVDLNACSSALSVHMPLVSCLMRPSVAVKGAMAGRAARSGGYAM